MTTATSNSDVEDLALLPEVNADTAAKVLRVRLQRNCIYTRLGRTVVAVNPRQDVQIFSDEVKRKVKFAQVVSAHPYSSAEQAYRAMLTSTSHQRSAIIPCGYRGSGKSTSIGHCARYLAWRDGQLGDSVLAKLEDALDVIDTFGSAEPTTTRSHYSRAIHLFYDDSGRATGARIEAMLYQKSRIAPASSVHRMKERLQRLGVAANQIRALLDVAGAISCLANATIIEGGTCDQDAVARAADYLHVSTEAINHAISFNEVLNQGRLYQLPITMVEALEARSSLCGLLSARLFYSLVSIVNKQLDTSSTAHTRSIVMLDFPGLERCEVNGFDQLCVNYVAERMLHAVLQTELRNVQRDYNRERCAFPLQQIVDNSNVCDVLDQTGASVLSLMEEGAASGASSFFHKMQSKLARSDVYEKPKRVAQKSFGLKHSHGLVHYDPTAFIDSNKLQIRELIRKLFAAPKDADILAITTQEDETTWPFHSVEVKAAVKRLTDLVEESNCCVIQCIVTSESAQPLTWDDDFVATQLKNNGIADTAAVRTTGLCVIVDNAVMMQRFGSLAPGVTTPPQQVAKAICEAKLPPIEFHVGVNKTFLAFGVLSKLEDAAGVAHTATPSPLGTPQLTVATPVPSAPPVIQLPVVPVVPTVVPSVPKDPLPAVVTSDSTLPVTSTQELSIPRAPSVSTFPTSDSEPDLVAAASRSENSSERARKLRADRDARRLKGQEQAAVSAATNRVKTGSTSDDAPSHSDVAVSAVIADDTHATHVELPPSADELRLQQRLDTAPQPTIAPVIEQPLPQPVDVEQPTAVVVAPAQQVAQVQQVTVQPIEPVQAVVEQLERPPISPLAREPVSIPVTSPPSDNVTTAQTAAVVHGARQAAPPSPSDSSEEDNVLASSPLLTSAAPTIPTAPVTQQILSAGVSVDESPMANIPKTSTPSVARGVPPLPPVPDSPSVATATPKPMEAIPSASQPLQTVVAAALASELPVEMKELLQALLSKQSELEKQIGDAKRAAVEQAKQEARKIATAIVSPPSSARDHYATQPHPTNQQTPHKRVSDHMQTTSPARMQSPARTASSQRLTPRSATPTRGASPYTPHRESPSPFYATTGSVPSQQYRSTPQLHPAVPRLASPQRDVSPMKTPARPSPYDAVLNPSRSVSPVKTPSRYETVQPRYLDHYRAVSSGPARMAMTERPLSPLKRPPTLARQGSPERRELQSAVRERTQHLLDTVGRIRNERDREYLQEQIRHEEAGIKELKDEMRRVSIFSRAMTPGVALRVQQNRRATSPLKRAVTDRNTESLSQLFTPKSASQASPGRAAIVAAAAADDFLTALSPNWLVGGERTRDTMAYPQVTRDGQIDALLTQYANQTRERQQQLDRNVAFDWSVNRRAVESAQQRRHATERTEDRQSDQELVGWLHSRLDLPLAPTARPDVYTSYRTGLRESRARAGQFQDPELMHR
eukprot:TRINITY_DN10619_c0_g1_i4.p1 TRINITY_DN10619_c0_g1~~TRINITY_DN10619_c0_g1_i4.p1  ORF type:complete len:1456 (-),score=352.84 TRINITY_DN10619_c0_g1_i4:137-4504(-)